jgi:hypothetical protein
MWEILPLELGLHLFPSHLELKHLGHYKTSVLLLPYHLHFQPQLLLPLEP